MDRCKCGYLAVEEIDGDGMCRGCATFHHIASVQEKTEKSRQDRWLNQQHLSRYSFDYIMWDLGLSDFPGVEITIHDIEFINQCKAADRDKS